VYMQHMVLSLPARVHGGQWVHSCLPTGHHELSQSVTVPYAECIQCILLKMSVYGSKHVEE